MVTTKRSHDQDQRGSRKDGGDKKAGAIKVLQTKSDLSDLLQRGSKTPSQEAPGKQKMHVRAVRKSVLRTQASADLMLWFPIPGFTWAPRNCPRTVRVRPAGVVAV